MCRFICGVSAHVDTMKDGRADKHISEHPKRIVGRSGGSMSEDNSWADCRGRRYKYSFYDANGNQRGSSRASAHVCVEILSCFCRIVLIFTLSTSEYASQIKQHSERPL